MYMNRRKKEKEGVGRRSKEEFVVKEAHKARWRQLM